MHWGPPEDDPEDLGVGTGGWVPPEARSWRHPSELHAAGVAAVLTAAHGWRRGAAIAVGTTALMAIVAGALLLANTGASRGSPTLDTSSPASRALAVGQIVTAVDGRATPDACAFARALGTHRAGQRVRLAVERSHVSTRADIVRGPVVHVTVRLGRWPSTVPHPTATPDCSGSGWHGQGYLGVETETLEAFAFPFPVALRTTSIGGPSAGLALTLGIIDTLSGGNLTGGRSIAATGTIAATGAVGEVGGVPEKTVAVERAGATAFFVPAAQVATARSKATPPLEVYGVSSLAQVLTDLRRLGGTVPPPRA